MKRLTRKEIQEGLKAVPIEQILIGKAESPQTRLTPKQIRFAEEIAKGHSKAEAYRRSRESKAKPSSASRQGQELMKNPAIVSQVEAFRLAIEAQKLATPAHLRALTIQKLTEGALDPEFPPAQRVKCLELLGKITEVALFTERREVVQVKDPEQVKKKLLESIRLAMKTGSAQDVDYSSGDELLAELQGAGNIEDPGSEPHPDATPQGTIGVPHSTLHTIPHTETSPKSEPHLPVETAMTNEQDDDCSVTCSPDTSEKSL